LIREAVNAFPNIAMDYLHGRLQTEPQLVGHKSYRMADFDEVALKRMLAVFGTGLTCDQLSKVRASTKCGC
jgi:hypothetical protein